jgi:S-phase kinase-associated protein 1
MELFLCVCVCLYAWCLDDSIPSTEICSESRHGVLPRGSFGMCFSWLVSHFTLCLIPTEDNEDQENNFEFPLPNVKSQVLKKVIEFCEHHLQEPMTEIEKPLKSQNMADVVQKWYADFVDVEQVLLFELILAANYMDIKPLLDLTCATVASMIKGKSADDIRATFNIKNDFSPEEEAQVREENKWCEEA